jgi:hypothetical protein
MNISKNSVLYTTVFLFTGWFLELLSLKFKFSSENKSVILQNSSIIISAIGYIFLFIFIKTENIFIKETEQRHEVKNRNIKYLIFFFILMFIGCMYIPLGVRVHMAYGSIGNFLFPISILVIVLSSYLIHLYFRGRFTKS